MNNTNKICPLRLIAFNKYTGMVSTEDFATRCACTKDCAWRVSYNDPNKSCCALVDIANAITDLPAYMH